MSAARHGRKTANGANAFVNFFFFDGHVGLFPSVNYNTPPGRLDPPGRQVQDRDDLLARGSVLIAATVLTTA